MKNSIWRIRGIFVEILAGTDIETAVNDCIKLADRSNMEVTFNFNGKLFQVNKNTNANEVIWSYRND